MAVTVQLGKIQREHDLRTVWSNEAQAFTPWLAEHLDALGDALGIAIELEERESSVGAFSLDILARDQDSGEAVVIENQIEQSDHEHLGKLITYASGKDAKWIVWIVKEAREEHRAAIEWLNKISDDTIGFFLVEIQLWKIDDSNPAPKFEVVEQPNGWSKAAKISGVSEGGAAVQFKYSYWTKFNDEAWNSRDAFTKIFKAHKASGERSYMLGIGSAKVYMALLVNTKTDVIAVEFAVNSPNLDKTNYDMLFTHKEEIEERVGVALDWRRLDDKKISRILLEIKVNLKDKAEWSEYFSMYKEWAVKVYNGFKPYIGSL